MMKRLALIALAFLGSMALVSAEVVRPAPNFSWVNVQGKVENLSAFKDRTIVLLITNSPRNWRFRGQLGQLNKLYQTFASRNTIFVAAFTETPGRVNSNIPFVLASDGPRVGFEYGSNEQFLIAIIGRDGNLDCVTDRILPAQRILDIAVNSFVNQELMRRP